MVGSRRSTLMEDGVSKTTSSFAPPGEGTGLERPDGLILPFQSCPGAPLSLDELRRLYTAADWGVVLGSKRARYAYGARTGRHAPLAMFRALTLPFLVEIESEAGLARELEERRALRLLCGFELRVPSRAMFWHFRHTPPGFFPEMMLRILVATALAGQTLDLCLPCVDRVPDGSPDPVGEQFTLTLSWYGPEIEICRTSPEVSPPDVESRGKSVGQLRDELVAWERPKRRKGLYAQLGLPAIVSVARPGLDTARFIIDEPGWLRPASGIRTRSKDTITTLGPATTQSYAACNMIVLRQGAPTEQVLLSRRVDGIWRGQYVLPGGKAKPGETLEDCAYRELREETGIRLVHGKPVSVNLVHLPGRSPAFSVGVVVTAHEGEPSDREPQFNEKWQWFDLANLPEDLSLPAELALNAYRDSRFNDLQWSDVDVRWRRSGPRAVQLTLEGLLASRGDRSPG